jgi:hypothetical protein
VANTTKPLNAAVAPLRHDDVLGNPWMAVRALHASRHPVPLPVLGDAHGVEMRWIDAPTVLARVVDLSAFRDWRYEPRVRDAMRHPAAKNPVALSVQGSAELPTTGRSDGDVREQPCEFYEAWTIREIHGAHHATACDAEPNTSEPRRSRRASSSLATVSFEGLVIDPASMRLMVDWLTRDSRANVF